MRILVTRTDRLGDVVLATPVLSKLKSLYPDAIITFLVQKQWMPLLNFQNGIEVMAYDPSEPEESLIERLRALRIDRAYVLRDEKHITRVVKKAGIPQRVGPYSSFRSFFHFNHGRWQKRSQCMMHEAEYNLDLVERRMPARQVSDLPKAMIETATEAKVRAENFLKSRELKDKGYYVIHPGSSGSSRYVSREALEALARALIAKGYPVCLSGGPREEPLLQQIKEKVPEVILMGEKEALGLDGLAEVYRRSRAVIAHGTGPLHVAAAVGAPTLAIFPPIFVLSEKRWGPLTTQRFVWTPNVDCPAKYKCLGERCRYFDCMDQFNVKSALSSLERISS